MPYCAAKCFANSSSLYPQKTTRAHIPAGNNKKTWKATEDASNNIFSQTTSGYSRPQNNLTVDPRYNRAPRHINDHKYKGPLNPVKQWRKQLASSGRNKSRRASISQSMEYPGGSTHLEKTYIVTDCSSCAPVLTTYLKENPALNDCSNCTVIRNQLSNFQPVSLNNPQRITRPRSSQTLLKKNYYTTTKDYLRSRVRLHDQNQLLSAIPDNTYAPIGSGAGPGHDLATYVPPSNSITTGSQAFHSTYCISDPSACCSTHIDGSFCATYVTYKPSNPVFSVQGAVSSGTRILDIKRRAIVTNNQDFYAPNGNKATLTVDGQVLPGSTPMLYRGNTVAPYFVKSKYQSINALSQIMFNKTRVGARMPSGGTGIMTVCLECEGDPCAVPGSGGNVICPIGEFLFGGEPAFGFVSADHPFGLGQHGNIKPNTYEGNPIMMAISLASTSTDPLKQLGITTLVAGTFPNPTYTITLTNISISASVSGVVPTTLIGSDDTLLLNNTSTPIWASTSANFKAILESSRSGVPYRINIS